MKKVSPKTLIVVLSVALVVALVIGGTLAYLQDVSVKTVNRFQKNTVDVDLSEVNGGPFSIIPGNKEAKDPQVTGMATVPSYVFLKVEDATEGLVSYAVDTPGWTALDGQDGVYYREFTPTADENTFAYYVLKGEGDGEYKNGYVTYNANITNATMNYDGTNPVTLSFTSYIIQKSDAFADVAAAWAAIVDLPVSSATITALDVSEIGEVTDEDGGWSGDLDLAVEFATTDTAEDIASADYKDYVVDFVLTFNKDITDGSVVHLFGNYGSYGWMGDDLAAGGKSGLDAGEKLYVLKDWLYPATGYTGAGFTYADVVNFVQTFSCGVAVDDDALKSGLTATLQLVMNDGTSEHVVCSQTYNLG